MVPVTLRNKTEIQNCSCRLLAFCVSFAKDTWARIILQIEFLKMEITIRSFQEENAGGTMAQREISKAKGGRKRPGASSFELGDEYERKVSADRVGAVVCMTGRGFKQHSG